MKTVDSFPILIVDDEDNIRKIIAYQLAQDGIQSDQARSGDEAIDLLQKNTYSCVISDVRMPGQDGMGVLEFVRHHCPGTPLILLTAFGTIDMAVQALKMGAFDFLSKPFDQNELIRCVRAAQSTFKFDNPHSSNTPSAYKAPVDAWVGRSSHYQELSQFIKKASIAPCHLIITGDMGTGKEVLAREIHQRSTPQAPFIRIHCGAVPPESLESELFGFEKGTHPTLLSGKPGKLELADQGTLLVEEIQLLPEPLQIKLLEAIQTKSVERIGNITHRKTSFRLIATSRKPLRPGDSLREDLFLVLNVMSAQTLPLREHMDDIDPIARHLLKQLDVKLKKAVKDFDPEVLKLFQKYSWPGNVRELANILERMMVQCQGFILQLKDIPADIQKRIEEGPDLREVQNQADHILEELDSEEMAGGLKEIVRTATQKLERSLIIDTLKSTNGNVTHAARKLEISRKSLQNKMKEFSLRERTAQTPTAP